MSYKQLSTMAAAAGLMALTVSGWAQSAPASAAPEVDLSTATQVLDLSTLIDMDRLLDRMAEQRVVFVGEHHDRYEDHLSQLAIIRGLQARGKPIAIGMEFFQQPFQIHLDAFIAGAIDEAQFLRRTEYFERWRYDYRLYRPILRFARENGIPLIALNLEEELTSKVGEVGIDGLSASERAKIPASIDRGDADYRKRMEAIFKFHPFAEERNFEHFIDVQLVWDEGMAERAARYLAENPERILIVLAGAGHLEHGQGIPQRLRRRGNLPSAIILNGSDRAMAPPAADYYLFPQPATLPAAGLLGVLLEHGSEGDGTRVDGFSEGSGAKAAGIEEGDRIVKIGDRPVERYADIRIALLDRRPGELVPVEVVRERALLGEERLRLEVELH